MIDWSKKITAEAAKAAAFASAKDAAIAELVAWSNAVAMAITGPVPLAEMLSWTAKEAAARAVIAGTATPAETRMIGVEANIGKSSAADLAGRIVANADLYRDAIAKLTALRIEAMRAGDKATTPAGVAEAVTAAQAAWVAA